MNNSQITPQAGKEGKKSLLLQGRMINTKKIRELSQHDTALPISYPAMRSKGVSRIVGGGDRKGDVTLFIKCSYFISVLCCDLGA